MKEFQKGQRIKTVSGGELDGNGKSFRSWAKAVRVLFTKSTITESPWR